MKDKNIMKLCLKVSDGFTCQLNGAEYEGYVPAFFPEEHYGDYVELNIDITTGKIVNWKKPTNKELKKLGLKSLS